MLPAKGIKDEKQGHVIHCLVGLPSRQHGIGVGNGNMSSFKNIFCKNLQVFFAKGNNQDFYFGYLKQKLWQLNYHCSSKGWVELRICLEWSFGHLKSFLSSTEGEVDSMLLFKISKEFDYIYTTLPFSYSLFQSSPLFLVPPLSFYLFHSILLFLSPFLFLPHTTLKHFLPACLILD